MKIKVLAALIGFACMSFFFGYTDFQMMADQVGGAASNTFKFRSNDNLNWLVNKPAPSPPASADVFFSSGDGGFFIGGYDNFVNNFTHNFPSNTTLTPYMEVTPKYDQNDKPPKRVIYTPGGTSIGSGTTSVVGNAFVDLHGARVLLQASRQPSPSDTVNFVIAFNKMKGENADSLVFTYNKDLFEWPTDPNTVSELYKINSPTASGLTLNTSLTAHGSLVWNIADASPMGSDAFDGTVIVTLKTKTNADLTARNAVSATLEVEGASFTDNIDQEVVESHDPNRKTVHPDICRSTVTELFYTIRFQNDGDGPADSVRIADVLDRELILSDLTVINGYPKKPDAIRHNGSCDSVTFVFGGINLRGLGEKGCSVKFPVEETMGWVKFKVKIDRSKVMPCSAILNEADIYFYDKLGVKAPVHTTQAVCRIPCSDSLACPSDTIKMPLITGTGSLASPISASATADVKWYPCEGIDASNPLSPVFTANRPIQYTCVVVEKGSCARKIYHQTVVPGQSSGNSNNGLGGGFWAILLAAIAALIAFFIFKNRPKPNGSCQKPTEQKY